jgi:hypothetical protein
VSLSSIKFYDVEDRAVAWINPSTALIFKSSKWVIASRQLARKAMLDGFELSRAEFLNEFPIAAAADLPTWFISEAELLDVSRDLKLRTSEAPDLS